jgi:hypothetical protein
VVVTALTLFDVVAVGVLHSKVKSLWKTI